jgi:hypothetical protein
MKELTQAATQTLRLRDQLKIWSVVQFAQNTLLVIPKPALSARNLLGSETADSSCDNPALRNDNPLGIFQTAPLPKYGVSNKTA